MTTGRRKRDEAHEPTQNEQQTAKKPENQEAHEQLPEQSQTATMTEESISRSDEYHGTMSTPEVPEESTAIASTAEADKAEATKAFMNAVGMHPGNPDASTKVVSSIPVLSFCHTCFNPTPNISLSHQLESSSATMVHERKIR